MRVFRPSDDSAMKKAFPTLVAVIVAAACAGGDSAEEAMPEMTETAEADVGTVTITAPMDGAEVAGPNVTVELTSTVDIKPAGDVTPGSGHHHLILDVDVSPAGVPIPPTDGVIVHMGDGSSTYTFEGLEPGEHRIIAVVADFAHIPLDPWVVDTVTFTVR